MEDGHVLGGPVVHNGRVEPDRTVKNLWEVSRWSFIVTVWPVTMFAAGAAAVVAGLTGVLRLWGEPPRWTYAIPLALGVTVMVVEYLQFNFIATRVVSDHNGSFTFIARKRTSHIKPGDVTGVEGWSSFSDSLRILPLRVRTVRSSIWLDRQVADLDQLFQSLKASNVSMNFRPQSLEWDSAR
jgi:hypothetical protein